MKKNFILILLLMLLSITLFAGQKDLRISNQLNEIIKKKSNSFVKINVFYKKSFDFETIKQKIKNLKKNQIRKIVYNSLKEFSFSTQERTIKILEKLKKQGYVNEITTIPINNVLNCRIRADKIQNLLQDYEIKFIDYDKKEKVLEKPKNTYSNATKEITWNVLKVNANDVWNMGYTGQNVLVAVIDTGVNYNHHDLMDHMWEDVNYPNHGFDFVNNDNNPIDDMGHGTHCAGTVAGDGTSGSQTGVAPDATIMALKVLDSDGSGSESGVWQAFNFALEHNADVVSLSLGWQHSWGPNRKAWRDAMVSLNEAQIVAAVAAGNEGDQTYSYPVPDNVRTPGDCPPPWLHPDQTLQGGTSAAIVVGASNSSDNVANFSSRGPVDWSNVNTYNDYPYNPEMGLIRPDVVAPGVNIKSLNYQSNTGYLDGWDGTSMAAPCVAGTIALMLSKNNTITPAQVDEILETTAVHLTSNKSNSSGSGRIDALSAVNSTPNPTSPPQDVINPVPENNSTNVMTGTTFSWENGFGGIPTYFKFYLGTDNPPTNIINGDTTSFNNYNYEQGLDFGTTYFWKVEAYNEYGNSNGTVWTFSTISSPDEDFETNNFDSFSWEFSGSADWEIDSENAISGLYCAKSGHIYNNQYSAIQITMEVSEDSEILFWKKVSSEENYDKLKFYIDNSIVGQWSGESDWSQEVFPVEAGTHTFKWKYLKLNGGDAGDDCAWIDYIVFPTTGTVEPPELNVTPMQFVFDIAENSAHSDTLMLSNTGGQDLIYNISVQYVQNDGWISLSQSSGTIQANDTNEINITFYSTNLQAGTYEANIIINDNREETVIPVQMNVQDVDVLNNDINQAHISLKNYPNPFNPITTISFEVPKNDMISLEIFNLKGELVKTLIKRNVSKGIHRIIWNGRNKKGQKVKSGIYFIKLQTSGKVISQKIILLK